MRLVCVRESGMFICVRVVYVCESSACVCVSVFVGVCVCVLG